VQLAMTTQPQEMIFTVRESPGGWIVQSGATNGPFLSKARALDLAEGMALAIQATGQAARVVLA
jgi:hypothetical protein